MKHKAEEKLENCIGHKVRNVRVVYHSNTLKDALNRASEVRSVHNGKFVSAQTLDQNSPRKPIQKRKID